MDRIRSDMEEKTIEWEPDVHKAYWGNGTNRGRDASARRVRRSRMRGARTLSPPTEVEVGEMSRTVSCGHPLSSDVTISRTTVHVCHTWTSKPARCRAETRGIDRRGSRDDL